MKQPRRREISAMSLSLLDVISCGFGAIVLLLVLTKIAEPLILEASLEDLEQQLTAQRDRLDALDGEIQALGREMDTKRRRIAEERARIERLRGDLSAIQGQFKASRQDLDVARIIQGRLAAAKQTLTEEMKRLREAPRPEPPDDTVGGIPVDSEYIIFVIDTSGSMHDYGWSLMLRKLAETLEVYPRVKGIQVMNDMGTYMFSQYAGRWIPDTPARRRAIIRRLSRWTPFSNSSPVEGITKAIQTFYAPDKRVSIYVFGDEFSGGSIESVVKTVDIINKPDAKGRRRVRIHAVGFPVQFARDPHLQTTGIRFATLMRILAQRNGGTFVGLNSFQR
jgi:hypothetical protein